MNIKRPFLINSLFILLSSLFLACQQTLPISTVSIALNPERAELSTGETRQFTATITGSSNPAVNWEASCGVLEGTGTSISYTAPDAPANCILTATSLADSSKSASAEVTVTLGATEPTDIRISIDPRAASLVQGQSQSFTASVTGTSNTAVTWEASCGSVQGSELTITYTAPAAEGSCTLTATSLADPTKTVTAMITVDSIGISIEPGSVSLFTGQGQSFTATVLGSEDTSVSWAATCGSVEGTGTTVSYTAPASAGECELTASSNADSSKTATASIIVTEVSISIDPQTASLTPGQSRSFSATVTGTSNTAVTWEASCGSVTGTGTLINYTAPEAEGPCALTAISIADPSKTVTATLTVSSISISIEPSSLESFLGQTHSISATVVGSPVSSVSWRLIPEDCGSFILGAGNMISYTAPASLPPSPCTITATSNADLRQQATLAISLHVVPTVGLSATPAAVAPGEQLVFSWSLSNPSSSLPLTCELRAFGEGSNPTFVINNSCGRLIPSHSVRHTYPDRGDYTASLTLKQGDFVLSTVSTRVSVANSFVQVSAGSSHSLAVDSGGNVWAWGRNVEGQLGDGTSGAANNRNAPVSVCASGSGASCVQFNIGTTGSVSTGGNHSLAMDSSGNVWAWGRNTSGQLGDGTTTNRNRPVAVCVSSSGASCVQFNIGTTGSVSAGNGQSLVVDRFGNVWAWGFNAAGQLGDGTTTNRNRPVRVCASGSGASCVHFNIGRTSSISAGSGHSLALDSSGNVWAWGSNFQGRLGDGTTTNRNRPVRVCAFNSGVACVPFNIGTTGSISAGREHSLAVDGNGNVWAWGDQLGDGTTTSRSNPVPVCARGSGATCERLNIGRTGSVSAGVHSLAVDFVGNVWAWGFNGLNSASILGDGTNINRSNPVKVCASGNGATCAQLNIGRSGSLSAGEFHSLVIDRSGNVWAWGRNGSGQLGEGTTTGQSNPVAVLVP